MRFTPTALFSQGLTQPCMEVTASGATSQSINVGAASWDVYLYTSSVFIGGGSTENYSFEVGSGVTTKAIVSVVGGGGSTSSDSRCGGGGGVSYQENITLKPGTYSVTVGQGGNGTDNGSPQSFSGDNGEQSRFVGGGIDITANGGSGGTQGGSGGDSGDGTTNTNGGVGGAGAAVNTKGDHGGVGRTVFVGYDPYIGDARPIFRAGGGAGASVGTHCGRSYGGGSNTSGRVGLGDAEQFVENVRTLGGGSGGGEWFDTLDSRYKSWGAGSGGVMIAIPTNLCTGSLYQIKNVSKGGLQHYWDITNARSIGQNAGTNVLTDIYRGENLQHLSDYVSSSAETSSLFQHQAFKDRTNFITDDEFAYLNENTRGANGGGEPLLKDYLSGSINLSVSTQFSAEIIYATNNGETSDSFLLSGSNGSYIRLHKDENDNGTYLRYRDSFSGTVYDTTEFNLGTSKNQHVITYDGTDINWYVDTILKDTITVSITSSLDNPTIFFGLDQLGRTDGLTKLSEARIYNIELGTSEIEQNYSASFGL
jgi:hypothetical protein